MKCNKILLVMAMHQEANPIIEHFQLQAQSTDTQLATRLLSGRAKQIDVMLVLSGTDKDYGVESIGTIPAALNTFWGIEQFNPDLILNAGTAGGFSKLGAEIGDVYLSKEVFQFHDRRINLGNDFYQYGKGLYPSFDTDAFATVLGLKQGKITTGDSFEMNASDAEVILENGGAIKEMEAAGIAYVASRYGIPMMAIKAVTDLVDTDAPENEQFIKNLTLASENLQKAVIKVIDYLQAHEL